MSGYSNQDSNQGGYDAFNGSSDTAGPKRYTGDQTMRAVTLKQIQDSKVVQDNIIKIDGHDLVQVTFIGIIRSVSEQASKYMYTVEDGTGVIEVRTWSEASATEEDEAKRRELVVDTYVRVFGRINNFNNRMNCISYTMRPIIDFNEINYHFLECVHTHLLLTVKPKPVVVAGAQTGQGHVTLDINAQVINVIKSFNEHDDGVHIDEVVEKLKAHHSPDSIRAAIEDLSNEGHCYATMDEFHIKSTESY
ncbi:hypothetical protein BDF14DRAFT_1829202 [Spinellus fusiger]|nr:hypothetical protein BDF14DRAFT_1829202 [Spinellus fusiger]